jgi:hypothetical protein
MWKVREIRGVYEGPRFRAQRVPETCLRNQLVVNNIGGSIAAAQGGSPADDDLNKAVMASRPELRERKTDVAVAASASVLYLPPKVCSRAKGAAKGGFAAILKAERLPIRSRASTGRRSSSPGTLWRRTSRSASTA